VRASSTVEKVSSGGGARSLLLMLAILGNPLCDYADGQAMETEEVRDGLRGVRIGPEMHSGRGSRYSWTCLRADRSGKPLRRAI